MQKRDKNKTVQEQVHIIHFQNLIYIPPIPNIFISLSIYKLLLYGIYSAYLSYKYLYWYTNSVYVVYPNKV